MSKMSQSRRQSQVVRSLSTFSLLCTPFPWNLADADKQQEHPDQEALSLHDTASRLKKWIQVFKPPLQIAVINALHLQRTPEKCQTQLLNVRVKPTFTTTSEASSIPIPHSFEVVDATVDSITGSLKFPEFDELLATFSERSKAIRASGGIGVTFVAVRIEELGIMQITPFGLPDLLDDVPYDREWMASLKQIVAMGRVI